MPIYKTNEKNKEGLTKYKVRINYILPNGKAKQLTRIAYGLQEAKKLESDLNFQTKDTSFEKNLTLLQLYKIYMDYKQSIVRASTLKKTRETLEHHVLVILGDYKLDKLTTRVFEKWKNDINNKNLLISTKHNIYSECRALLNYGVKMDYIKNNNLIKVGNFIDAYEIATRKTICYYNLEEFQAFQIAALEEANKNNYFDFYLFFTIAFYTGCRKGEINALTWRDYDRGKKALSITKSISQKLKGGDVVTPPKNMNSNRKIKLPDKLVAALNEHYDRSKATYESFSDDYAICGGIIPLRDTTICNAQKRYEQLANVHHIKIHDFRHSHASLLINSGVNIMEVSRRLGHSNVAETLNTYSHLYPQEEDKAIAILNQI